LFVPRSGVNHVSVMAGPAISPLTIPSIRNYVHHAWCSPPPRPHVHDRAAYNSRLTPFEYNFHNDMREQEEVELRGLPHDSTWHTERTTRQMTIGPRHYTPPKPIFFEDNERPGRRTVYHRCQPCATLTLCIVLVAVTKSWTMWWLKDKRESLSKVQWTLPASQIATFFSNPLYCGSSSVVENHFEGVSVGIGFKERQL